MSFRSLTVELPGPPKARRSVEQRIVHKQDLVLAEPERVLVYGVHADGCDLATAVEARADVERITRLVFYVVVLL